MADLENQDTEVIEDVQDTDVDVKDTPDDIKEDDRVSTDDKDSTDSVLSWIREKQKEGEKADSDDFQDDIDKDLDDKSDDSGEFTEDIPDEFTAAARAANWTDKEIKDFAGDHPDEALLEMIPQLDAKLKSLKESDSQEQAKESGQEGKSSVPEKESDIDVTREQLKEELKKELMEEFSGVKEDLRKAEEERRVQTFVEMEHKANEIFDEISKDFEIFGKTESLPKFPNGEFIESSPAFKARSDVYDVAMMFLQTGKSQNMTNAMKDALSWYKGKNLEKDLERKLIKNLKKGEKRLSAKRTAKDVAKTYDHPDDEKADIVKGIAKKVGVDLEY